MMTVKTKYIIHMVTFLVALLVILFAYTVITKHTFSFNEQVLLGRNCKKNLKNCQVEDYLNTGKIVVFGSSEVSFPISLNQKYTPTHFFSRINKPILFNGTRGYMSFGMLAQIVSYYNKNLQNNARIVIILSPLSFYSRNYSQTKSKLINHLKSYEFKRIFFVGNDVIDKTYKNYIIDYMKNKYKVTIPFFLNESKFLLKDQEKTSPKYNYNFKKNSQIEYLKYYNDALKIEKKLDSNNNIGMRNNIYTKYRKFLPYSHIITTIKLYYNRKLI